ncbi:MAG: hypothetical protein P8J87_02805 [Verrucomicrobiales bacterium]|nr:hypothetical protein [Verrucomicrobiales bacterium]
MPLTLPSLNQPATAMKKTTTLIAATLALTFGATAPGSFAEEKKKQGVTLSEVYDKARLAFTKGDIDTAKKLFSHIAKYKPDHLPSRSYLAQIKLIEDQRPGNATLERKLSSIVLGEVDINDVPVADAIAYLKVRSKAESADGYTPNILLNNLTPEQQKTPIKLHLTKVPLSYALKAVGDAIKVQFRYEKHAIVGSPRPANPTTDTASTN